MVVRPLFGYFRWSLSDPSGPTLEYVKSINTLGLAQIGLRPPPPGQGQGYTRVGLQVEKCYRVPGTVKSYHDAIGAAVIAHAAETEV